MSRTDSSTDADTHRLDTLATVRDWLRYAVSRFTAIGLVYGHGTATPLDEAAFLILETLRLPVDELEPWLDARLLLDERRALAAIIDARISTRKPAPYLTQSAYIRGHRFFVDEQVIVPRSFLGELLCDDGLDSALAEPAAVRRILDLCTGGGSLAILAAMAFPDATMVAADISPGALAVAWRNVTDYGLGERMRLVRSDLFEALGNETFDLILSNPPYVTAAAVAAFPPEYKAEPELAHLGGVDGMDLVRRILADAPRHLAANGSLVVEIGQGRATLEAAYPDLPFLWLATEGSDGEVFALPAAVLPGKPARRKPRR